MNYSEIIINGSPAKLIPLGDCACGCGGKTVIPPKNAKREGWIKGQPKKFLMGHWAKLTGGRSWHGGWHMFDGYMHLLKPDHPRANVKGYVAEHILIAEKALGKPLPDGACVHHANGSRDNGPTVICQDHAYHMFLHQRQRALKACGHANWRKCPFCKQYDDPGNMKFNENKAYHAECKNSYNRNRIARKKFEVAL